MFKNESLTSSAEAEFAAILRPTAAPPKYRLSQSLTKELTDTEDCPLRIKTHSIDQKFRRPESEVLIKGQLFEYLSLGSTNREGNIPVLSYVKKTKKNPAGEPSADEVRIRRQAALFWDKMGEWGFEVIGRDCKIETRYNHELLLDGIIDIRARRHGKPCIVDVKCVQNLRSEWGYYGFGNFAEVDKIQADTYMYIEHKNWGIELPFYYAVFDYKTNPECELFEVEGRDIFREATMHTRILASLDKIKEYDRTEWPVRPSYTTCNSKCSNLACSFRVTERPPKV